MRTVRSCPKVWLCDTSDKRDICYRHYHTCSRTEGHAGACACGSGPEHTSEHRLGEVLLSVSDAYRAMAAMGWER